MDLMVRGGRNSMGHSISDTAEHGASTGGTRVVTGETGRPWFEAQGRIERSHVIEEVGARLRAMMPILDAVTVTPEGDGRRISRETVR